MDSEITFSVAATIVQNYFELAGVALDNKSSPVSHDDVIGIPDSLDLIGLFGEEEQAFLSDQSVIGELKESVVSESVGVVAGGAITPCFSTGSVGDECDLLSLPSTPIDEPDTNFFEVFTDLSAQIAQEYVAEQQQKELQESQGYLSMETISIEDIVQPCIPPPSPVESSSSATQSRATLKRKARAMEATSSKMAAEEYANDMQIDADKQMSLVLASVESDHDYTLKSPKRARRPDVTTPKEETVVSGSSCSTAALSDSNLNLSKEEKYFERRVKNNIASRRSRKTRKDKFSTMEEQAITLAEANEELEKKIVLMENLAKAMKDALVKKMAGK